MLDRVSCVPCSAAVMYILFNLLMIYSTISGFQWFSNFINIAGNFYFRYYLGLYSIEGFDKSTRYICN